MRVVILDQFCGLTPYLLENFRKDGKNFRVSDFEVGGSMHDLCTPSPRKKPRVENIDPSTYELEECTTVLEEDLDGVLKVWRYRWDSSG